MHRTYLQCRQPSAKQIGLIHHGHTIGKRGAISILGGTYVPPKNADCLLCTIDVPQVPRRISGMPSFKAEKEQWQ